MGGYGPLVHLANLLDHEFQALSGFINVGNTLTHKVKHEALSQFTRIRFQRYRVPRFPFSCFALPDSFSTVSRASVLEDELTNISVQS
jgi:hypothetical protein